jgi:hypothetical protein
MSQRQVDATRTVTVMQGEETASREKVLLKVTIYPWGVEFDLPQEVVQE